MDVERGRHAASFSGGKGELRQAVGEKAEVGATAGGHESGRGAQRGRRKFVQVAGRTLQDVRIAVAAGVSIPGAKDRKEAGVIAVAFLDEDVERPLTAP